MNQKRNLVIAIVLSAAAGLLTLQNVFAPAPGEVTQIPEMESAITEMPVIDTELPATDAPTSEVCAYVWAYHNEPKLTEKVDNAVRAINPAASARAQLFGEDCVYADGHSTFGAMETDFYVHLPADDLTDEEALGTWMAQVMPLVAEIPRGEIQGNYGFVEFWFEKSETEQIIARVPIQQYSGEAQQKTGAEFFRLFSNAP